MQVTQKSALLVLCLTALLSSCSDKRPETVEYFKKVTSIPLCKRAKIININSSDTGRNSGFDSIYNVNLIMDKECVKIFLSDISSISKSKCKKIEGCKFSLHNSEKIFVNIILNGLNVIHST